MVELKENLLMQTEITLGLRKNIYILGIYKE